MPKEKLTVQADGMYLVVIFTFENYQKGDMITDPDTIAAILNSDNSDNVQISKR